MCSLRDAAKDLESLNVKILACSLDEVVVQTRFAKEQQVSYPLLSDADGSVARKYRVLPLGSAFARRVTYVIDPKGHIRLIDREVDVDGHGKDLAERIRALQAE